MRVLMATRIAHSVGAQRALLQSGHRWPPSSGRNDGLELQGRMSDDDLWEVARARTREDVRQIFARIPDAPQRTCPHCGEQAQTREEHCPACGRSYFERPDRFSRRTRRIPQAVGALAAAILLRSSSWCSSTRRATTGRPRASAPAASARRAATRWPTTRAATISTCAATGPLLLRGRRRDGQQRRHHLDPRRALRRDHRLPAGRLTWCKDNPTSASDIRSALAFVRLSRECTAARGPVFGSGYLIEPRG